MLIVHSSVLGLETEAAHLVDVEGGLGGGSGGVMMVTVLQLVEPNTQ